MTSWCQSIVQQWNGRPRLHCVYSLFNGFPIILVDDNDIGGTRPEFEGEIYGTQRPHTKVLGTTDTPERCTDDR
jgi:hypothetical protein